MKILLTGASGMLAAEVISVLEKRGDTLIKTDLRQGSSGIESLDVANLSAVLELAEGNQPDYIFHFAAETNVDLCQTDADHAFRVNTIGTENVVLACKKTGCRMLYVSTGNVFDGSKPSPYIEFDKPNPINIYGESKLQAELIVKNLLSEYFIVRAGWMTGGRRINKKFVYKIIQQLKEGKDHITAVNDKFGSLTFTGDFAVNLMNIIDTKRYGTYHLVNKGTCSRYDIAVKIVEFMGLKNKVNVLPVDSKKFPLPAPRARSEMMRNYKLDLLGMNSMPFWEESLEKYIKLNKDK
jgi:dTDP-4-dehydrorhamnose reductase